MLLAAPAQVLAECRTSLPVAASAASFSADAADPIAEPAMLIDRGDSESEGGGDSALGADDAPSTNKRRRQVGGNDNGL
jgi:hypothetical protein